ncbi:MAG: ARMT1-like domain-containing protein [Candidatus Sedimenticola sp. 20ELBAFRAG]
MRSKPECDQCFLRQAIHAAKLSNLDTGSTKRLISAVKDELAHTAVDVTPPVRASRVHAVVRSISGNPDPYRQAKQQATSHALELYPQLKQLLEQSDDPLDTAVRLAIAGNIIDLGVASHYDLEGSIRRVLQEPLAIDHLDALREALDRVDSVLYLADNAGETVMDRLLIETIGKPVTYVVKGGPAVNDATVEDAKAAGLDQVCNITDNGAAILGTLLEQVSPRFRERFDTAELIIAKGMANYESLSGSDRPIFFLLQAKCPVISEHLGVAEKSIVVLKQQFNQTG